LHSRRSIESGGGVAIHPHMLKINQLDASNYLAIAKHF